MEVIEVVIEEVRITMGMTCIPRISPWLGISMMKYKAVKIRTWERNKFTKEKKDKSMASLRDFTVITKDGCG